MKKPWIALWLNFVLPGAGLAYLGMWKFAVLNFALVHLAILVALWFSTDPVILEHFHYILLALAAASAGAAHALARQRNSGPNVVT